MGKCAKCTKSVSKKNPGIQCNKCNKWLHALCASLTTEQLSALHGADSIDWKCRSCALIAGGKPKRISVILPDPENEESDTEGTGGDNQKIMGELRKELREMRTSVREIIRDELQKSLSYYSDKIDEYDNQMKDFDTRLKLMENQCKDAMNNNKNLTLVNEVLEQKLNKMEQAQSCNDVEICGSEEAPNEKVSQIVEAFATAIDCQPSDVLKTYRKRKQARSGTAQAERSKQDAAIVVTLREGCREQWLRAARRANISAQDIGGIGSKEVHLREALSPTIAFLLWKTKKDLKEKALCQFVWCKNGVIMVRKSESDKKIHYVRTSKDIEKIAKELSK